MNQTSLSITVFFEDPFWIALFEYREDPFSYLKRVVFGSEPSEQLVYDWVIQNWYELCFHEAVEAVTKKAAHKNPKRSQREARKSMASCIPCTKAQLAKKKQQEEHAVRKTQRRKDKKEAQKEAFRLHQLKKRQSTRVINLILYQSSTTGMQCIPFSYGQSACLYRDCFDFE